MKPALILLHGALGASKQLKSLKDELSNHFEVYTFDFEGHGGRPSDNSFSIDLFTQNVIDFMTTNSIASSHFFGYSMGGYVALNLAMKDSNLVDRIFTYGTKFDWTPEAAAKESKMMNPDIIIEKVPKFAAALNVLHAPLDWKMNMKKTAEMMINLGDVKGFSDEQLSAIQQKVLIGIGDQDQMVTIEESNHAAQLLPNGRLHVFSEFVHPIERIDIDLIAKEIINFLID